jgi:type II secretory pathway pseudopilin PulG
MKQASGFTLLELLLVFGLVGVVTLAGTVGLSALQETFTLRSTGDEIRSLMRLARENSLAGRDELSYRVALNNDIVTLENSAGTQLERYQAPKGVNFTPDSFIWTFLPASGEVTGCIAPCQLTLTYGSSTEIVRITQSGIIE